MDFFSFSVGFGIGLVLGSGLGLGLGLDCCVFWFGIFGTVGGCCGGIYTFVVCSCGVWILFVSLFVSGVDILLFSEITYPSCPEI